MTHFLRGLAMVMTLTALGFTFSRQFDSALVWMTLTSFALWLAVLVREYEPNGEVR